MKHILVVAAMHFAIGLTLVTTPWEGVAQEIDQPGSDSLPDIEGPSRASPSPNASDRSTPRSFTEVVIRLDEDQSYSLREFCLECNQKLGTGYAIDVLPDRRIQLTQQEQRLLRLLARPEVFGDDVGVDIERDRLILCLPNPESNETREEQRRRIESLLGVPASQWPVGKGLHLPDHFVAERPSVLLIHGLEASLADLQGLSQASLRSGLQTLLFDYPNDGPIAVSGRRLHHELAQLAKQFPQLRLAIVAHSMGGLVAREALENCRPPLSFVTDVFLLGTPHQGAALSDGQPWLELVFQSLAPESTEWGSVRDGLGEAAQDLKPGSFFLRTLDPRRRPAGARYHAAIGRRGFVDAAQLSNLRRQLDDRLQQRGASDLQRARLSGFLDRADALCSGKGDGAVTTASAGLAGADSQRTFDLSHIELLQVPERAPESAPVFQWILTILRSRQ